MQKYVFLITFLLCSIGLDRAAAGNVGKTLPPLSVDFISNAPKATAGKPMIVEFWATWCPPCRESIPHMNEIYKNYKDRGLVVIGISSENKGKITDFMKTLPMNYSVATDSGQRYSGQFGITGIPHALLVNSAGKIVWEGHPMSLETSEIDKILTPGAATPTPAPASTTPDQLQPLPANKKFY